MPTNVELDAIDRDLLFRQASLLYPEVEPWIINMSIDAYLSSEERAPKGLKSLGKEEEEEEEPNPEALKGAFAPSGKTEPNVSKQCDDEICVSCGS